jgi:hypothetical protein
MNVRVRFAYQGVIVNVPDHEDDPSVAVIVAEVSLETFVVVTLNVAEVFPPRTVTGPETIAEPLLLVIWIVIPSAGAAEPSFTVPVEVLPPTRLAGSSVNDSSTGGSIIKLALWVDPLKVAMILAVVTAATAIVVMSKFTVDFPAGTVTEASTDAAELELLRFTTAPPTGASPTSVIVPIAFVRPVTSVGLTVTDPRLVAVTVRVADWEAESLTAVIVTGV